MSSGIGPNISPNTTFEDDPEPYPYCGPTKWQPKLCFNLYQDVFLGDFVLCRPCDGYRLHMWLGRVLLTVDLFPNSNYGTFVVET